MAGRGTDILLGGNPEYLARQEMREEGYDDELIEASTAYNDTDDENILAARKKFQELYSKFKVHTDAEKQKVVEAGGLYVIGTERHESRRIDNQLRGRSGRQGDPGSSKFYLSLDDDLMRQFGGDRMLGMFNSLGVDEDTEIQHRMLTNAISSAQKKVEGRNFGIRKNVLEYDDVMNQQREVIYKERRQVLEGHDLQDVFESYINSSIEKIFNDFLIAHEHTDKSSMDLVGFLTQLRDITGELSVYKDLEERVAEGESFNNILADVQELSLIHISEPTRQVR